MAITLDSIVNDFRAYRQKSGSLGFSDFKAFVKYHPTNEEYGKAFSCVKDALADLSLDFMPEREDVETAAKLLGALKERVPKKEDKPDYVWLLKEAILLQGNSRKQADKAAVKIVEAGLRKEVGLVYKPETLYADEKERIEKEKEIEAEKRRIYKQKGWSDEKIECEIVRGYIESGGESSKIMTGIQKIRHCPDMLRSLKDSARKVKDFHLASEIEHELDGDHVPKLEEMFFDEKDVQKFVNVGYISNLEKAFEYALRAKVQKDLRVKLNETDTFHQVVNSAHLLSDSYDTGVGIMPSGQFQAYIFSKMGLPVISFRYEEGRAQWQNEPNLRGRKVLLIDRNAADRQKLEIVVNAVKAKKPESIGFYTDNSSLFDTKTRKIISCMSNVPECIREKTYHPTNMLDYSNFYKAFSKFREAVLR
jgi:hypothetical protein